MPTTKESIAMLKLSPICHCFFTPAIAIAILLVAGSVDAVPVSYTANINTMAGNPVTNIMILESDGTQTFLDYTFSLPGRGLSVLTHDSPFVPTKSLVVGLTEGIDDTEIVMLLNSGFAQANAGQKFSVAFPNTRHSELITRLTAAEAGDTGQLDWFRDTFFPGDGAAAAFDTGGPFSVAEFTALAIIGVSATSGNWIPTSILSVPPGDGQSESNLETVIIGETATDVGPFDIQLQSFAPNSYAIAKNVLNSSGAAWNNFELILGTDLGGDFVPSTAGDGLSFLDSFPNREDTGAFSSPVVLEDRLLFSGFLGEGDIAEFVAFVNSTSEALITVRQLPTLVPEPSTATLAIGGVLALLVRRRKRTASPITIAPQINAAQ